jgi:hypothetical protein
MPEIMLGAASRIGPELRTERVLRLSAWTAFRLVPGVTVAALVYSAVLFVFAETYSLSQPLGAAVYGVGFVLATVLAVVAGALVSPAQLSKIVVPGTCALAVMFPIGLNIYFGAMAEWQPIYLLYLLGSIWGGYAVAWLMPRSDGRSQLWPAE